jgi:hypothetical protein
MLVSLEPTPGLEPRNRPITSGLHGVSQHDGPCRSVTFRLVSGLRCAGRAGIAA